MNHPDDLNLSDAILTALRDAGWIGQLVRKDSARVRLERRGRTKAVKRPSVPMPTGLVLPPGVIWSAWAGRFLSRLHIDRLHAPLHLGKCGPCQADIDALGALWQRARALRDAGMSKSAIREELGL